jgi:hypothetical protein
VYLGSYCSNEQREKVWRVCRWVHRVLRYRRETENLRTACDRVDGCRAGALYLLLVDCTDDRDLRGWTYGSEIIYERCRARREWRGEGRRMRRRGR